jgi:hypothetical protein
MAVPGGSGFLPESPVSVPAVDGQEPALPSWTNWLPCNGQEPRARAACPPRCGKAGLLCGRLTSLAQTNRAERFAAPEGPKGAGA